MGDCGKKNPRLLLGIAGLIRHISCPNIFYMGNNMRTLATLPATLFLAGMASLALAQTGPGGGFLGANRQVDPSMIAQAIAQGINGAQQRQLTQLKTALGMTDDEFQAIQPLVQGLLQAQANARMSQARTQLGSAMRGRAAQQAAANGIDISAISDALNSYTNGAAPDPVAVATAELQSAVNDPNSSPDLLAAKLAILRAAKSKAAEDLTVLQNQLKQLLTQRQEAVCVMRGLIS
jgi:hypothetical protein